MSMRPFVLALVLLLSACAGQSPVIQVESTRFHQVGMAPRSFVVLPPAGQAPDALFTATADQVVTAMTALGWRQSGADDGRAAVVRLRYGTDAPVRETVLSPSAVPPVGAWGYRRRWDDPFPYWQAERVVYVPKWLSLTIADGDDVRAPLLFEGRVTSRRGGAEIGPILPYLVRGMFDGFPGPNGGTEQKALTVQP
ncbi:MAG: hypothetical protein HYU59_06925 [Magnetospirillum gryphiswaldense]|nr:hypothetical protein [Magnetospirillum gryphiswaldense]